MYYDVFISYSTEDKKFVDALVHTLERNDIRCWYAPRDIPAGESWPTAITKAIQSAHIMLLLFSQASNNSQEVPKELALASTHRRLVIPVRIEDVLPSVEMQYHLINRHWLDVYGLNISSAVQKVMDSLGQYRHLFRDDHEEEPAFGPEVRPPIRADVERRGPAKWLKPALVGGLFCLALTLLLVLSWPKSETGP